MTTALVLGLIWLGLTGVLCIVVGRAIRAADRTDDVGSRAARRSRSRTTGGSAGAVPAADPAPSVDELEHWYRTGSAPGDRRRDPSDDGPEDAR
ncbi:hypothetical protein [Modestobacter sp. SSW1-42]|uniref:hypothetical protein n=1 Tax=Modestobacter sp. SSW1-42 TaxID=596372 RepID=UPI003985E5E2